MNNGLAADDPQTLARMQARIKAAHNALEPSGFRHQPDQLPSV